MTLEFMEVPMSQNVSEAQRQSLLVAENERLAREAEINQKDVEISQKGEVPSMTNSPPLESVTMTQPEQVPNLDYGSQKPPVLSSAQDEYSNLSGNVPWISGNRFLQLPMEQYTSDEDMQNINIEERRGMIEDNRSEAERRISSARSRLNSVPAGSPIWERYNNELNEILEYNNPLLNSATSDSEMLDVVESRVESASAESVRVEEERRLSVLKDALERSEDEDQSNSIRESITEIENDMTETNPNTDIKSEDEAADVAADVAADAGNAIIDAANDPENTDVPESAGPEVEEVAQRDPTGFSKAMNWISDVMGVESNDFLRAGIYYAGSRLAGTSHHGAMNFAFSAAMAGVESRESTMASLIQSGKYTSESLELFRNSKDVSDLEQVGVANPVNLDMTQVYYYTDPETGAQSTVYKGSSDAGEAYYNTNTGQPVSATNVSESTRAEAAVEAINSSMKFAPSVIENVIDQFPDMEDSAKADMMTGIGEAIETIHDNFGFNGGDFDNATVTTILETATKAAILSGSNSIVRHIDEAMIQYKGFDWSDALMDSKGNRMPVEEFNLISDRIMGAASATEGFDVGSHDRSIIIQNTMDTLWEDWEAMTAEQRKVYQDNVGGDEGETPFGNWLKTQI